MNLLKGGQGTKIERPIKFWHFVFLFILPLVFLAIVFGSPRIQKNLPPEETQEQGSWNKLKNFITFIDSGLRGDKNDRTNILLLGKGGANHEGPDLTDTIIILSMQIKTGEAALLSVPRDLYIESGKWGERKINNVYALSEAFRRGSGARFTSDVLEKIFRIPIHYYIVADFDGFREIVNALGGVRVYVDRTFTDSGFPADNFQVQTVYFKSGWQIMNGETALQYARSRHGTNGENTDFARARRQQKILLAVKDKLLSHQVITNPAKLVEVALILRKYVATNVAASDLWRLAKTADSFNSGRARTVVLDDGPNGVLEAKVNQDGAYILVPKNNDWGKLRDIAKNIFKTQALTSN